MNKTTAKKIAESGITVGQIKNMLKAAYDAGAVDDSRSSVNKGASKSVTFNIFWGAYKDKNDDIVIRGNECLGAKNAIWEFGDFWDGEIPKPKRMQKDVPDGYFHQTPVNPHAVI